MFRSVTCKLGNMRKAVEWTIYPRDAGQQYVQIQSDSRIAQIRLDGTLKGVLSKHCGGGAYNIHLQQALGATVIDVPQTVIDEILAQGNYTNGEALGQGVYVGGIKE